MNRTLAIAVLFAAAPLHAAEITATIKDGEITFKNGDEIITVYKYEGTVKDEKGTGTKPLAKPYFHPLNAPGGIPVTRAWPMVRGTPGETTDHFHQKSAWFGHGDVIAEGLELKTRTKDKNVKGVDFWSEEPGHGRIVCIMAERMDGVEKGVVRVSTANEWRSADNVLLLTELRIITVRAVAKGYLITVHVSFNPEYAITFGDTKEGTFAVRVPDAFRLTVADSKGVVTSSDGTTAKAPARENLPMWGKHADWHDYSGEVDGKAAGIAIFAYPSKTFPAAWHTRAYGLMAANPFAREGSKFPDMKAKKEPFRIPKGEVAGRLWYAIYTHTGNAKTGDVDQVFKQNLDNR